MTSCTDLKSTITQTNKSDLLSISALRRDVQSGWRLRYVLVIELHVNAVLTCITSLIRT